MMVLKLLARAFFHSFREDHEMMHLRDLQKLEGVLSPSHLEVNYYPYFRRQFVSLSCIHTHIRNNFCFTDLKEMEFAHSLRQSKVNIKICQVIFLSSSMKLLYPGAHLHCNICIVITHFFTLEDHFHRKVVTKITNCLRPLGFQTLFVMGLDC